MNSIRKSMSIWMAVAVMLLGAGAAVICYFRAQAVLANEFDQNLMARADALTALVHYEPNGKLAITETVGNVSDFESPRRASYFEIWDSHGRVLQRSHSLKGGDFPPLPAGDKTEIWNLTLPDGRPGRAVRLHFTPGTETQEDERDQAGEPHKAKPATVPAAKPSNERMTLVVMGDLAPVQRVERALIGSLALATGVLCLGVLVVVPLVVRHGLTAVRRLSEWASGIDASTLGQRFDEKRIPKELHPICSRLNDLLGRLDNSFGRERRFTGNVAHELRTPISELRALAEVSLRWPGDAAATHGAFSEVLAIANRMESVVKMLLSLARCEMGSARVARMPSDLVAMVSDAWKAIAPAAEQRNVVMGLIRPAPQIMVQSEPTLLRKIIDNLLANAVEYCLPSTRIVCRIEVLDSGDVQLCLQNTAAALLPADATMALEPFWRKDTGGTDSQHAGLGLSLVKTYAAALQAEFDVQVLENSAFQVRLRLKPAKTPAKQPEPTPELAAAPAQ